MELFTEEDTLRFLFSLQPIMYYTHASRQIGKILTKKLRDKI